MPGKRAKVLAHIDGLFGAPRPWDQESQYGAGNSQRRHHDPDSDSDTSHIEDLATDDESTDSSTEEAQKEDHNASRSRLAVPASHKGHKRAVSANSTSSRDSGSAKTNKDPYDNIWEEAERDFKNKHPNTAEKFYILENDIFRKVQNDGQKKGADKNDGFQSTLIHTKVFLNRSRKGKTTVVKKKISKFLMVISKLAAPIGAITAADPMIAQPAWSGVCVLLQLCLNFTQKEAELLGDVEKVVDIIDLYSALRDRYSEAANSDSKLYKPLYKRTTSLFSNILYFQASAAHRLNQHVLKRGLNEAFGLDVWADQINDIQNDNTSCQQALDNASDEKLSNMIKNLQSSMDKEISLLNQREQKIIEWLSDIHMEDYHTEVLLKSEQYRDRGRWFIEDIDKWLENQPKKLVYWLHAIYGMGKTFLISRAIDHIEKAIQQNPDRQLAYFYFSEERGHNTPEDAIRNLLSQLAITPDGSIATSIEMLYDSAPTPKSLSSDLRQPSKLGLKECLKEMGVLLEAQVNSIIVIDAVDECQDYGRFLRLIKSVLPKGKNSVRLIMSSKEGIGSEMAKIFSSPTSKKLDAETNDLDIKHYVDIQIKKRDSENIGSRLLDGFCTTCKTRKTAGTCKNCKAREDLEDKLVKLLTEKSQGMFKWVELQISLFFQPNSPFQAQKDVEDQIWKLRNMKGEPQLNKIWAQILERNANGSAAQRIAQRVYKWLLYSYLPMSKTSLTEAVSSPLGSQVTSDDIAALGSNLIEVNNNIVHFAHPTVRQYLEQAKDKKGIKLYSASESHKQIATRCLEFLKTTPPPKIAIDSFKATEWKFETYAATLWPIHLREILEIPKTDTLRELTTDFFVRKLFRTNFKIWAESWMEVIQQETLRVKANGMGTIKGDIGLSTKYPEAYSLITSLLSVPPDPFFAACMFGLPEVCRINKNEISKPPKSEARNFKDELGVFLAIKSQRLDALQMLISADIDITKAWQSGNNALHWAAIHGTTRMVELLLKHGLDISSINDDGATVLHLAAASAYDPLDKVTLLSNKNLDPNRGDTNGATVLHYAVQSSQASLKLMKKLEDLSINFNATDSARETALHYAVQNPNISTNAVKKLLDEVKDVNAICKTGETALAYLIGAESAPRTTLTELFIEGWDASLDIVDDEGTVLHRAVKNSKFSMSLVKKLLSKDSINKLDKLGRTALHCAFLPCHEISATSSIRNRTKTIVLMLLEAGADCTLADKSKATALHYLARAPAQPSGLMKEVLEKANTNAVDNLKATALHTALRHNKLSTTADLTAMKLLIKATEDLSKADCAGETVLHRAIRNTATSEEILSLLLDGGANINAVDQTGSTVLHYSVEVRHPKITQFLLDKNANLKALDSQQASALHRTSASVTSTRATTITLLVKNGLDVNARDKEGRTPVHISAQLGGKNGMSALVERFSADMLAVNENKDTVLHFAVLNYKRSVEVTSYLLGRKVAVNVGNKNKETALHYAAKKGSSDVVRSLIDAGANCLAQSKNGETALHFAVQRSTPSAKIINMLIDAKSEILDVTNNSGETALYCAVKNKKSADGYCALLQKGCSTKAKGNKNVNVIDTTAADGQTALHRAASQGWLQALGLLLKYKADVNAKDKNEWTPLLFAASVGDGIILKKLLDANALVNHKAKDGTTALHLAAANGHHECARQLLDKKANIEEEDITHRTPLWRAVSGNHERVARLLLQHEANYNAKSPDGKTLLHRAATLGYVSMARLLLEKGAKKDAKDKNTATPLYQAVKQKSVVMIALLLDYDVKTVESIQSKHKAESYKTRLAYRDSLVDQLIKTSELEVAASKGDTAVIQKILSNKATASLVNSKNELGNNALCSAAWSGQDAAVALLIDKFHADLKSQNAEGNTPLHCAARKGHAKVARRLVDAKADLSALNDFARTPLHVAARNDQLDVVKVLLASKGIQPNVLDKGSETPLVLAIRRKYVQIAEFLAGNDKVDVEKPDGKGLTPMHWAEVGKLDGVKAQLEKRGMKAKSKSDGPKV